MNIENDIKVSVCVVTYNQENYIAECLESLVKQVTNFKFEIIVGEDCSTDSTREIIQKYIQQYPDLIIPLFYEKNVGAVENLKQVYIKAKGKYIAHMDGDDLALPGKLQKQFDILEKNLDCNVCSHDVIRINNMGVDQNNSWIYPPGNYDLFDLYRQLPFFSHSSKMFRNKYDVNFWNEVLNDSKILDIDVHVANCIDGNIYHIGELLGAYRVNAGVSWIEGKINPVLPLGVKRVFDKGLIVFKNDLQKSNELKEIYAYAMLSQAYHYAIIDKDPKLFKEYVYKSVEIKKIGFIQKLFCFATYFPKLSFYFFLMRAKRKI
ncbi:glycosyltransferase family 2 protein [Acinetobacter pittii]|uniref:glycosyltransferase family 2 protein n=1 Tax=Acinetobacter pittii TaxID=48296 RepID=UPI0005C5F546|nr:glycosyltransferase family 2 protein [Acinetobacter pittii]